MSSEIGLTKVRGVFRRRKLSIILTAIGVLVVGAFLIRTLEPGYKAMAVIRAGEVSPSKEYVAPVVAEQLGERLKSLRLAVMARPVVAQAVRELNLTEGKDPDEIADRLRSRMDVKLEGEDTFLLSYTDRDPERAKAVVNRVAELFMRHSVEHRQEVAGATVAAFKGEADALRPQVEAAEKAVRDFKLKHYGSLPEQTEGNLRTLDQATMEINIQSTNLDMDLERRRQLLAAAMSPLRHHEETLAGELYEARTKYTPDHPEVRRIQAEYEHVKAQRIDDEKDLTNKVRRNNPELMALDGEIDRTRAMIGGLRTRQNDLRRRVDDTARNGQVLAGLVNDYETVRDKHHLAAGHLRDAELAASLEKGLAGMRFDLVEGAAVPARAVAQSRSLLAFGALLLALALGFGVGFALDSADSAIRDPEQLRDVAASTPVLAVIPKVEWPSGRFVSHGPKAEA